MLIFLHKNRKDVNVWVKKLNDILRPQNNSRMEVDNNLRVQRVGPQTESAFLAAVESFKFRRAVDLLP